MYMVIPADEAYLGLYGMRGLNSYPTEELAVKAAKENPVTSQSGFSVVKVVSTYAIQSQLVKTL